MQTLHNQKIYVTKKYDIFKNIKGNRKVRGAHISKLAKSMKERNLMPWQPVMVTKKMMVIDGQHRILAAKKENLEVFYVIVPNYGLHEIHLLNANHKSWMLMDYVECHIINGNLNYEILLDFVKEYKLPLTTSASLLSGSTVHSGGGLLQPLIKEGKFLVKTEREAHRIANILKDIAPFTEKGVWRSREFVRALTDFYDKGASHKELLKKLSRRNDKIRNLSNYGLYLIFLQDVYNYQRKKQKINIF